MSADEYIAAVYAAIAKLQWIIEREGDMDGARNEPEYLDMLIQEQIYQNKIAEVLQ